MWESEGRGEWEFGGKGKGPGVGHRRQSEGVKKKLKRCLLFTNFLRATNKPSNFSVAEYKTPTTL